VIGILEGAALEIRSEVMRRVLVALVVRVGQAGVLPVGVRVPAEVVIEGAVLLHQHDEGVDGHVRGARERGRRLNPARVAHQRIHRPCARYTGYARHGRGLGEELPSPDRLLAAVRQGDTTFSQP
jgi:hypothetical protein